MAGRLFELDPQELGWAGVAGTALALMAWPHVRQDAVRRDW